jgi:myo-inositol-1-phosphate synthase
VGAINAFNLIDGLDGLASGLAIIASLGMAGSIFFAGDCADILPYLVLAGACCGFLRYNFHPASVSGWFSTNILGNRDGEVLDQPENFKTKEVSKLSVIDNIFEPEKFPDLYGDVYHKVRINYYPPRKDNKEAWDNIDIFGWMGYPMEIKVNFLCRDSILAAPIALDLVIFSDLALRAGMCGIQTWLSFFCKSPMHDFEHEPVHDLFQQWRMVKETLRNMVGETAPSYLD